MVQKRRGIPQGGGKIMVDVAIRDLKTNETGLGIETKFQGCDVKEGKDVQNSTRKESHRSVANAWRAGDKKWVLEEHQHPLRQRERSYIAPTCTPRPNFFSYWRQRRLESAECGTAVFLSKIATRMTTTTTTRRLLSFGIHRNQENNGNPVWSPVLTVVMESSIGKKKLSAINQSKMENKSGPNVQSGRYISCWLCYSFNKMY